MDKKTIDTHIETIVAQVGSQYILTIKVYREISGLGLQETKRICDEWKGDKEWPFNREDLRRLFYPLIHIDQDFIKKALEKIEWAMQNYQNLLCDTPFDAAKLMINRLKNKTEL